MKRITNIKKYASGKGLISLSVVLTLSSVFIITVWQTPMALAISLEEIKVSREVAASVDKVWNIVSNIELVTV